MKNILVVGSNGLLGQTLINRLTNSDYNLFTLARGFNRNKKFKSNQYFDIDITDKEFLSFTINKIKPDIIINVAAVTNVDYCETNKKECDDVNFESVRTMIKGAQINHSHLIHISTDFVFDGEKGNYIETDQVNPINYYGLSKLKAEKLFEKTNISYTILRTALVFGYQSNLKKQNILLWLIEKLKNKVPITIVNDQFRTPTYVEDLAEACILALQKKVYGIYHISGTELMNMFELSNLVAKTFNFDSKLISAIPSSQLKQAAVRPKITGFDISKAKRDLNFNPLSFVDALARVKAGI